MPFLQKFEPRDIIAVIVLIAAFLLIFLGIDHFVGLVLAAVIAYYFGEGFMLKHKNDYVAVKVKK